MTDENRECGMSCTALHPADSALSRNELQAAIQGCFTADVFVYTEAVSRCAIEKVSKDAFSLPEDADAFEGHIFDSTTDVRWTKSTDGWRAWKTTDSEGKGFEATTRHYYLLGEYDKERTGGLGAAGITAFSEGRYPGQVFTYPVSGAKEHDRAYIDVVEYRRCKPASWSTDDTKLSADLDAPLLCGHRFVAVGVGRE